MLPADWSISTSWDLFASTFYGERCYGICLFRFVLAALNGPWPLPPEFVQSRTGSDPDFTDVAEILNTVIPVQNHPLVGGYLANQKDTFIIWTKCPDPKLYCKYNYIDGQAKRVNINACHIPDVSCIRSSHSSLSPTVGAFFSTPGCLPIQYRTQKNLTLHKCQSLFVSHVQFTCCTPAHSCIVAAI